LSAIQFQDGLDGASYGQGTVHNGCDQTIEMMIDITASVTKGAPPLVDAPTVWVANVQPGATSSFTARVPAGFLVDWFSWNRWWFRDVDRSSFCMAVGTTQCLPVDPWLASTVNVLEGFANGQWLLKVAAENGVVVKRRQLPIGTLGSYRPSTKTITIDERLDSYSNKVRATVLAHELQHAADDAAGLLDPSACYANEEAAFHREAEIWADFWAAGLPPNVDTMHQELNEITLTVQRDPVGFALDLLPLYRDQCGG
jgi:hypothetical protein